MRISAVKGTIDVLGVSNVSSREFTIYDYISIITEDQGDVMVRRVKVWNEVDRLLNTGSFGTFIFMKVPLGGNELHAIKIDDREAFSRWLVSGLGGIYFFLVIGLILGVLTSVFLIGIPLAIVCIWGLIMFPSWKRQLRDVAEQNGFKFNTSKIL